MIKFFAILLAVVGVLVFIYAAKCTFDTTTPCKVTRCIYCISFVQFLLAYLTLCLDK